MFQDMGIKPKGEEIRIRLDSGANCDSANVQIVMPVDLGFENKAAFLSASDEQKHQAVVEFFNGDGYPEYSWDVESPKE
jgi:hypothetical protein